MPQWIDEQYMWMSVATLVAFGVILYQLGHRPPRPELAVEGRAGAGGGPEGGGGDEGGSDDGGSDGGAGEPKWWGLKKGGGGSSPKESNPK